MRNLLLVVLMLFALSLTAQKNDLLACGTSIEFSKPSELINPNQSNGIDINNAYDLSGMVKRGVLIEKSQLLVKEKRPQTITFLLNGNSEYILGIKGENVNIEIDGTSFDMKFSKITIKTTKFQTLKIRVNSNKKGKIIAVLHYVSKI